MLTDRMINLLYIKLKAGALQYTIFISVVIALLVFAFIGLSFVQQKLRLKNTVFKEVIYKNELAFHALGTNNKSLISTENGIETSISRKQWGLFEVMTVTSKKGKEQFTKTALVGRSYKDKPALYLQEENQPLVVVGNTKIEGNAVLPEQGVKQGSISGHSYINNQLIYGTVLKSNSQLPKAENFAGLKRFEDSIIINENFGPLDIVNSAEVINPFTVKTQLFYANQPIDLHTIRLVGNIIIRSDTKVIIHKSASLNDIIIIAPEIEIKEGVVGNFQAFADNKLIVNERVQLNYPTSLLLSEKKAVINQQNEQVHDVNQLLIKENATIKGIVGFLTENSNDNYKTQLIIEEDTVITGEVYCQQNIELKGTVNGSVYTKGFIANQFGSVYKNHIYNGQILSSKLPEQYAGLNFKNSKQKVAKWLYY